MNHYVVHLTVIAGEYEKSAVHFVQAETPDQAETIAIYDESRTPGLLEYPDDGLVYDLGGEFAYSVKKVVPVPVEHAAILAKYLGSDQQYEEA